MSSAAQADEQPGILLITARADVGGGPEHVLQLLQALGGQYRVHVACPNEPPYWGRYADCIGTQRMLAIPHRRVSPRTVVALSRFIRRHRIGLVHTHGYAAGVLGRPAAQLAGVPAMHTQHGMFFLMHRTPLTVLKCLLERQLAARDAATVYVSEDERRMAQRFHIAGPRARVIANGVAGPAPASLHVAQPRERLRIVNVNRFDVYKNPLGLLDILVALRKQLGAEALLRLPQVDVYGDGPLRARFEKRIDSLGLSAQVRALGNVGDLRARLPSYDLLLSCSHWEGLPITVLEAMSCGLPVLLSRVTGHGDLLRRGLDEAGFEPGDARGAARRLLAFHDTALRARLGALGPAIVSRHYGRSPMLDAIDDCYAQVLTADAVTGLAPIA